MSNDQPVFEEEIQPKKGMSTTAMVVLVMLGVGGVAMLLCCGGLFGAGVWLKRTVDQAQVTNPVEVEQLAQEIASIRLPEEYRPQMGLQIPILGMRMAIYNRTDSPQAMAMLMENNMGMNPADSAQRDQMLSQMKQQMGMQGADLSETEVREIEVAGQKVPFQFGTLTKNGVKLRQVMGFVPLNKGLVLVTIAAPVDDFDDDAVVAILQSIGEPGTAADNEAASGSPSATPTGETATQPSPAGDNAGDNPPPVDEPVEAEQPEPASVPQ